MENQKLNEQLEAIKKHHKETYDYICGQVHILSEALNKMYSRPGSETVKEKEYTILSFISKNGDIFEDKGNGAFVSKMLTQPVITEEIGLKAYRIHSVRRESDGEIFTLGDKLVYGSDTEVINKFSIIHTDEIAIHFGDGMIALAPARKAPIRKPILITEDGKEMYEGDEYYFVDSIEEHSFGRFTPIKETLTSLGTSDMAGRFRFSTLEKAEEYIKWNKPMYSLNDINKANNKSLMENKDLIKVIQELGRK